MQKKYTVDAGYPYKIWKTRPPGEEQLELNRLFEVGKIDRSMTADVARNKWPIFQRVTPRVFATHFRTTKAKYDCQTRTSENIGCKQLSTPSPKQNGASISIKNPPLVSWMYIDHEKKRDFVVVAMSVISGTHDFKFRLSDDGCSVTVTYSWPLAFYTAELMFEGLPKTDPMVHSFISHLAQMGITEKSEPPQGSITIKLMCSVQREVSDFENCFVQSDDAKLIVMRFAAYTYGRRIYYDQ